MGLLALGSPGLSKWFSYSKDSVSVLTEFTEVDQVTPVELLKLSPRK